VSRQPNLYFFRDEEGYEPAEVEARIQVEDLRSIPSPVEEILDEAGLEHSIMDESKEEILHRIQTNVDTDRYEQFMEDLLDETGEKGDKANLQAYYLPGVAHQEILQKLQETDSESDTGNRLLDSVTRYRELEEISGIDIQFSVDNIGDYFSNDSLELVSENVNSLTFGEFVQKAEEEGVLEELGIDDINALRQKQQLEVEARVYTDDEILFVSNREIWDKLQTNIRDRLQEWGNSSASAGSLTLKETELLYIQNVMGGDNSGLDFSHFIDDNLNTAKYRGPRQESLTRSPVLGPAQDEGEITQVRFYYPYEDWVVQVRLHDDGHLTTTKHTQPDFANTVAEHLSTALEYREYLTSIGNRINEFAPKKENNQSHFNKRNYKKTRISAFKNLVDKYILSKSYSKSEKIVFASILTNVCIHLGKLNLDGSVYPDPDEFDESEYPDGYREMKGFLDDYFTLELTRPSQNFEVLLTHLHHIFSEVHQQPAERPVDIVNSVDQAYDLRN
jgi:hypothetical protein